MKPKLMNMAAMALSALLCLATVAAQAMPMYITLNNVYRAGTSDEISATGYFLVNDALTESDAVAAFYSYGASYESTIASLAALTRGIDDGYWSDNADVNAFGTMYVICFDQDNNYMYVSPTADPEWDEDGGVYTVYIDAGDTSGALAKSASGGWQGAGWYTQSAPEPATVAVTGVTLNQNEAAMTVGGETLTLTATVNPEGATDKSVSWSTSDGNVATVENGVVTAVAAGTATITVTTTDGTKTATCTVTVAAPAPTYTVSLKEDTEDDSNWQGKAGTGEYRALPLEGVAAGTAVTVKYNGTKKVKSVKAVKVMRTAIVTAPTAVAASLTYSGSAQTLFSAGSTTGGTMKYKVTTTNSKPESTADFKTTIDQGTNAGTYYLWYYVDGGDNYISTDVNGTAVTKAIGKATASVTAPTAVAASLTYSGSAQTLFSAGSTTGGTMKYKVTTTNSKPESTADFKTTIDQGTNAGTYYLWYYVDGGDNYNTTDVNGTAVTKEIGKATATLTCSNGAISFSSSEATNSTKTKTGVSCTGGTINVASANTGNCTVSYSSGTITVTRKNNSAFTNTQITVSVTPDGNHTAPSNVTFNVSAAARPASSATSSDKGKLIGRDGKIYDNVAAATAAGTTAVAKIIYIGTTGHATYSHGLALALTDEAGTMSWQYAATTGCNTYKNTNTPVTNATWLLASMAQWNYMITAAGSYTALRDGFSSVGGSNLQSYYYWSSTEYDSSDAWDYDFASGGWKHASKGDGLRVRACLAF